MGRIVSGKLSAKTSMSITVKHTHTQKFCRKLCVRTFITLPRPKTPECSRRTHCESFRFTRLFPSCVSSSHVTSSICASHNTRIHSYAVELRCLVAYRTHMRYCLSLSNVNILRQPNGGWLDFMYGAHVMGATRLCFWLLTSKTVKRAFTHISHIQLVRNVQVHEHTTRIAELYGGAHVLGAADVWLVVTVPFVWWVTWDCFTLVL